MGNTFARPRQTQQFNGIPQGVPVPQVAVGVAPPIAAPAAAVAPEQIAAIVANADREVVAAQGVAAPALDGSDRLALSVSAEREALSSGSEQTLLTMVSIKAPCPPAEVNRPPIDLVVAADRSGSMHGEKIKLMKMTLELLVKRSGLSERDRVSLVTFDSQVRLELPLEKMDAEGRAKAEGVVRRIHPGSTTNLSGGALKAIDVLDSSAAASGWLAPKAGVGEKEARTRAVMLFTDGLANEGIRNPQQLCSAVNGALTAASAKLGGPISLFTFGFGADHNDDLLRSLATSSGAGGLYYYVSKAEDIPNAFADCLGGLTSVVAQNATLSLEGEGGATVARVLGSAYTYANGQVALGDLFAEDEKDVLVQLSLPSLPAAAPTAPCLRASLRAFNICRSAPEELTAILEVARPTEAPTEQPVNTALDAQRNRVETAAAMETASRLADEGDLDGGRRMLMSARERVMASASASHTLSANLVAQSDEILDNYRSMSSYRAVGSKMAKMQARSHQMQRAVHTNPSSYNAGAKRKAALKSSWFGSSSLGSGAVDSDSD